jgi:hypothetical protein
MQECSTSAVDLRLHFSWLRACDGSHISLACLPQSKIMRLSPSRHGGDDRCKPKCAARHSRKASVERDETHYQGFKAKGKRRPTVWIFAFSSSARNNPDGERMNAQSRQKWTLDFVLGRNCAFLAQPLHWPCHDQGCKSRFSRWIWPPASGGDVET